MTKILDLTAVSKKLLEGNTSFGLLCLIFRQYGTAWAHLDFDAAAAELKVDRRTVSRTVKRLAAQGLLYVQAAELRIADAYIKERAV